jgi:hypothetical protein
MDAREGHHATGFRDPHGPIDHPDHEDHDSALEMMKGGVRTAGVCTFGTSTIVVGTILVGIDGAEVSGPIAEDERIGGAKGSLDANGVGHRETGFGAIAARWRCAPAAQRAFGACI